jgi:hypothetical protein
VETRSALGSSPFHLRRAILACSASLLIPVNVLAQSGPAEGLRPGEVRVGIAFSITTTYEGDTQGQETRTAHGLFGVGGVFAAKLDAPAPGRRTLTEFRRVGQGVSGLMEDRWGYERTHEYGEGGSFAWHTKREESWSAGSIPLSTPGFFIDIDLDASTWTIADFEDEPSRWHSDFQQVAHYSGSFIQPDDDGQSTWRVSGNPADASIGIFGWVTLTGMNIAEAPSDYSIRKVRSPQPLYRQDGHLSGSAGGANPQAIDNYKMRWDMNWGIYENPSDLELQVTARGFETWRPESGTPPDSIEKKAGPALTLTAQVVRPEGPPPAVRIRKLRWSLNDTSRLPGYALNHPYSSTDKSPDLEISSDKATDEKQTLVHENLTTLKSTIRILPYDWGAWSTLRVEAELDDGRKLQGVYKGPNGSQTDILLPARDPDSKISRHWRKQNGARGADDSDEDVFPFYPGARRGDGLSLFEEYRGFYVGGTAGSAAPKPGHVSTSPLRRQVFVYDRRNDGDTKEALRRFSNASQLNVLFIRPEDGFIEESRIVNRNRGDGPSIGVQHAIGIRRESSILWRPSGAGGRPARSDVRIPNPSLFSAHAQKLRTKPELYHRAIAQELLHACGVPYAGTGDRRVTLTIQRGPDGGPLIRSDTGETLTLRDESGHDLGEDWLKDIDKAVQDVALRMRGSPYASSAIQAARTSESTRTHYVAKQGGQHSGPLGNIMRYTFADGYRVEGTRTIIMLPKGFVETVGRELSTTSQGDGYNAAGATPRRYGDSPNPPPAKSLVVSDQAP